MNNLLIYLSQEYAFYSVLIPWCITILWYVFEGRKGIVPNKIIYGWMVCTIASYYMSEWEITNEYRALYITPVFFLFVAMHLYTKQTITPLTAYSLMFTSVFIIDVVRSLELVATGDESYSTFYFGIGGAGIKDGLVIFPLVTAALIPYVAWRHRHAKPASKLTSVLRLWP